MKLSFLEKSKKARDLYPVTLSTLSLTYDPLLSPLIPLVNLNASLGYLMYVCTYAAVTHCLQKNRKIKANRSIKLSFLKTF
jgi:hypothetical protein